MAYGRLQVSEVYSVPRAGAALATDEGVMRTYPVKCQHHQASQTSGLRTKGNEKKIFFLFKNEKKRIFLKKSILKDQKMNGQLVSGSQRGMNYESGSAALCTTFGPVYTGQTC